MSAFNNGEVVQLINDIDASTYTKFLSSVLKKSGLEGYTDRPIIVNGVQVGKYTIYPINLPLDDSNDPVKGYINKMIFDNYANMATNVTSQSCPVPPPYINNMGIHFTNAQFIGMEYTATSSTFTVKKVNNIPNATTVGMFVMTIGH
jgi:hypothetical protein